MAGSIETRLRRLEGAKGRGRGDTVSRDAMRTRERLAKIETHIRAGGDFADKANASPAERYVRAVLRSDDAAAAEILKAVLSSD